MCPGNLKRDAADWKVLRFHSLDYKINQEYLGKKIVQRFLKRTTMQAAFIKLCRVGNTDEGPHVFQAALWPWRSRAGQSVDSHLIQDLGVRVQGVITLSNPGSRCLPMHTETRIVLTDLSDTAVI